MANQPSNFIVHFPHQGRNYWPNVFKDDAATWVEAIETIGCVTLQVDSQEISVQLDWQQSANLMRQSSQLQRRLYFKQFSTAAEAMELYNQDSELRPVLRCGVSPSSSRSIAYVRQVLYMLYLALNLAEPGCAGFAGVEIRPDAQEAPSDEFARQSKHLQLSIPSHLNAPTCH
jgi:hypothetical protein